MTTVIIFDACWFWFVEDQQPATKKRLDMFSDAREGMQECMHSRKSNPGFGFCFWGVFLLICGRLDHINIATGALNTHPFYETNERRERERET